MTNLEFITKTISVEATKPRFHGSLFTAPNGTVYSYGWHYPLARIINGYGFVNNRGYSHTTSRHISHARTACAAKVGISKTYGVPLRNGEALTITGIMQAATRELNDLTQQMAAKKRTNTAVYDNLERQAVAMTEVLGVAHTIMSELIA